MCIKLSLELPDVSFHCIAYKHSLRIKLGIFVASIQVSLNVLCKSVSNGLNVEDPDIFSTSLVS